MAAEQGTGLHFNFKKQVSGLNRHAMVMVDRGDPMAGCDHLKVGW